MPASRIPSLSLTTKKKRRPKAALFSKECCKNGLQRRFDLKAPGLQQRLGDILRVLVPASPLPQPGRPDVLVRCKLELLDDNLERGQCRHYRTDGLRLAPIR